MKNTLFLILFMVGSFGSLLAENKSERPNVIFILTDQWRSSAFGYAGDPNVKTPNIDRFSEQAVIFRNCVSVCPVCTPYRASLLTGRYPTSTGMYLNDLYLPERELCMAEIYKANGYTTAYYGKWHLDGHGRSNNVQPYRRQGFDYWKALECSHDYNKMAYYENDDFEIKYWDEYSPFAIVKDAADYLEMVVKEENPFLLFLSIETPHFPHQTAPGEYKQMYPPQNLILRENVTEDKFPDLRTELQGYYAHCTATDKAIGDLIAKIKELGIYDNSIIIFTSDHGELMGSHGVRPKEKQFAWDESAMVPFLIHYPGIGDNAGKDVFTPITTPDILPAMLSLSGIKIPDCIEGEDISPVVKNPGKKVDRAALFMSVSPFATTPFTEYRGIKTTKFTYVKTPGEATMLFDNLKDPYQLNNLVNKPEFKALQSEMDNLLVKELEKIGDADFKKAEYYNAKFGYDKRTIPYTTEQGKIVKVYTPNNADLFEKLK
jgi:arylsulfatase A-like enzyme